MTVFMVHSYMLTGTFLYVDILHGRGCDEAGVCMMDQEYTLSMYSGQMGSGSTKTGRKNHLHAHHHYHQSAPSHSIVLLHFCSLFCLLHFLLNKKIKHLLR